MRRRAWLLAAVALLALAGWLMSRGDEPLRDAAPSVEFPRYLRPQEHERAAKRRTLTGAVQPASAERIPPESPQQDPVLVALPRAPGRSAVVIEANALRHSPIGELMLACFTQGAERDLEKMKEELGFDPLEDIDRIAYGGEVMLVSGNFAEVKLDQFAKEERRYGEHGRIVLPSAGGETAALWRDELLLLADDEASIESAIDRLEGREKAEPAITEDQTYGEVYGVISGEDVARILGQDQAALAERIREAAERIELHVDARGDVAIFADVSGPQAEHVRDLGKSLGAALAIGRIKAQAEGEDELAELLDLARVVPQGDRFGLELALPLALLEKHLGDCRNREPPPAAEPPPPVAEEAPLRGP